MTGIQIPESCIAIHGVFDLNRDWPCKRASFIYYLQNEVREIKKTEERLVRTSSQYKARNLSAWIADATARLHKNLDHLPTIECSDSH